MKIKSPPRKDYREMVSGTNCYWLGRIKFDLNFLVRSCEFYKYEWCK